MNYSMLFIGLFLVALGFLVRRYPILISGYNTMSAKEKENVDIKGAFGFHVPMSGSDGGGAQWKLLFLRLDAVVDDSCIRTGVRSADFCCICAGEGAEV